MTSNEIDDSFIKGVVIFSSLYEDLSMHGSFFNVQIYQVLGEDGNGYFGTHDACFIGNCFIRTKEEHIEKLKFKIKNGYVQILKLQQKNDEYSKQMITLHMDLQ